MILKVKMKFKVGDTALYCRRIITEHSIIANIKINRVGIEYNGKDYDIKYRVSNVNDGLGDIFFANECDLFESMVTIMDIERTKKKNKLEGEAKFANKILKHQMGKIKIIKDQLDEIKKEELTIKLSGISAGK